ncbi:hypothetical protein RRG08_061607 [Elysia crispata]|uniref:Uncharacterized protein n=1 Tax=Elysia crispata TaxID=231223 RepID=A0AAE0YT44_9GAST|nr:hypothetical protein RRG08_061607 [Elysia crispata]
MCQGHPVRSTRRRMFYSAAVKQLETYRRTGPIGGERGMVGVAAIPDFIENFCPMRGRQFENLELTRGRPPRPPRDMSEIWREMMAVLLSEVMAKSLPLPGQDYNEIRVWPSHDVMPRLSCPSKRRINRVKTLWLSALE